MPIGPIVIPNDLCFYGHLIENHEPYCVVMEDGIECLCAWFTSDDTYWRYWFAEEIVEEVDEECSTL
jgi:hypothetical protein